MLFSVAKDPSSFVWSMLSYIRVFLVRDRAWFVRLYGKIIPELGRGDNPRALARGLSTVQAHKPCSISLVPYYSE